VFSSKLTKFFIEPAEGGRIAVFGLKTRIGLGGIEEFYSHREYPPTPKASSDKQRPQRGKLFIADSTSNNIFEED
jgi:hypothetical protein